MATTTTLPAQTEISREGYLKTTYRPDCDFVDGRLAHRRPPEGEYTEQEIEELFVGEWEHNRLQILLGAWFVAHEFEWPISAVTEQRMDVSPTRIRVCDVCVLRSDAPRESVTITPPFLCIEIMSPTDRLSRAKVVLDDYRRMGVPHIWLIDPFHRKAWVYNASGDASGLTEVPVERMAIPDSPVYIPLGDMLTRIGL
jgi:Uma2 family endonuclease